MRRSRSRLPSRPPAARLVALLAAMVIGLCAILARLVVLQVKDASALQTLALDQRQRQVPLPATRGTIYDRSGQALAMSLPGKAVFADPHLVTNPQGEAATIASVLGLDQAAVYEGLTKTTVNGHTNRFVYLDRAVDLQTAARLAAYTLPGIGFQDATIRDYTAGALAPQVLGYVGVDGSGLAGLESQYQRLLAGRQGEEAYARNMISKPASVLTAAICCGLVAMAGCARRQESKTAPTVRIWDLSGDDWYFNSYPGNPSIQLNVVQSGASFEGYVKQGSLRWPAGYKMITGTVREDGTILCRTHYHNSSTPSAQSPFTGDSFKCPDSFGGGYTVFRKSHTLYHPQRS